MILNMEGILDKFLIVCTIVATLEIGGGLIYYIGWNIKDIWEHTISVTIVDKYIDNYNNFYVTTYTGDYKLPNKEMYNKLEINETYIVRIKGLEYKTYHWHPTIIKINHHVK